MEKKTTFATIILIVFLLTGTNYKINLIEGKTEDEISFEIENPLNIYLSSFYVQDNLFYQAPAEIAYLLDPISEFYIYNESDYQNRESIGYYHLQPNSEKFRGIYQNDSLLYLLTEFKQPEKTIGFEIVDISDCTSPEYISSFSIDDYSDYFANPNLVDSKLEFIQFKGNYAFILEGLEIGIYDCTNLTTPTRVASYGNRGNPYFVLNGDVMYTFNETFLDIVNIENETSPISLSMIEVGNIAPLFLHNDLLCIGSDYSNYNSNTKSFQAQFFDISNETNPELITDFSIYQISEFIDVAYQDDLAFFISPNYVSIYDISNINNPLFINDFNFTELFELADEFFGYFYWGIADNFRLYLARISTNADFTVVILDFSNYFNLEIYGPNFDTATFSKNLEINSASIWFICSSCFVISLFLRKIIRKRRKK